jgi:hypothetical protein
VVLPEIPVLKNPWTIIGYGMGAPMILPTDNVSAFEYIYQPRVLQCTFNSTHFDINSGLGSGFWKATALLCQCII